MYVLEQKTLRSPWIKIHEAKTKQQIRSFVRALPRGKTASFRVLTITRHGLTCMTNNVHSERI